MGTLQNSMRTEMEIRGYAKHTIESYLCCVRIFAKHFGRSPLLVTSEEIGSFFHYLRLRNKSASTIHLYYVSLRFFYQLNNITNRLPNLTFKRIRNKVPMILSQEKVVRMLDSCRSLRYKALFTLAYSSGLRTSELRDLAVHDIDFDQEAGIRTQREERSQPILNSWKQGHPTYSDVYECL